VDEEAFAAVSGFPEAVVREEPVGPPRPATPEERTFTDIANLLASLGEGPAPVPTQMDPVVDEPRARPVIVIDPGHGGRDPGMIAVTGTQEKEIVLDIGRAMRDVLNGSGLFDAYLTRSTDLFLTLNDRYAIAQEIEADLFISLHVDSNDDEDARGVTIYTLSEQASDSEAARVAERENQSDAIAGYEVDEELTRILIDLAQRETMNLSSELAEIMVRTFQTERVNMVSRPHRFAGFRVLTAPDVPSILLETGFGTNPQDARLLESDAYHQGLGRAMTQALILYFGMGSVGETWIAQNAGQN
jgi:N-acetylmuramoyl-L-alanine amidase